MRKHLKIGDILIEQGLIEYSQLEDILRLQKEEHKGRKIGDLLIAEGYVTEIQLMQALSRRLKIEFRDLTNMTIQTEIVQLLDEQIARKYTLVPIQKIEDTLVIAMSDPMNLLAIEDVRLDTKMNVLTVISTPTEIKSIIERCYSGQQAVTAAEALKKEFDSREIVDLDRLSSEAIENAPVVKMINSIILQAVKLGASDIHIEAGKAMTRIRMRIDGQLHEQLQLHRASHDALVTRLKIMAHMNIAEKRIPQDGRFELRIENQLVDVRISSLPTINGEKIVIRILNTQDNIVVGKDQLGLTPHNMEKFEKMIKSPNGLVLVTGPTGSGKSTTLYAVLQELNKVQDNIITLEDPVEKKIEGINQVQINAKAGLTFASGLRSILRQDPNVVMVGEIRDTETAAIAIRSAITGHVVFSTLHTNDAITTIMRLADMGIEPYLIASSLVGVVAQRLVRLNCKHCQDSYLATQEDCEILGLEEPVVLQKSKGCQHCNFTGYKGRIAIHEVILITREIRNMITQGKNSSDLKRYCKEQEMEFLADNMKQLILAGKTTVEEFIKVTYSID